MSSLKLNGDSAYEEMADMMLERAEEGKMTDDEFKTFVVKSLVISNKRLSQSEEMIIKTVEVIDRYPPLLWLIRKRPKSTIPFIVGLMSLLSGFFISDIRMYVLGLLGFPGGNLPASAPIVALSLTIGGFVLSLIFSSTEGRLEDEIDEEK